MRVILFVLFGFFANEAAMAAKHGLLEFSGTPLKMIEDVPIYSRASVKIKIGQTEKTVPLFLTGAGIRAKKIVFVKVKGYVAASYVDTEKPLDGNNPMGSLDSATVKAIQLTLLRDIGVERIRDGFADSLRANKIDPTLPAIKKTLDQITFDARKGSTVTLLGYRSGPDQDAMKWELPGSSFEVKGDNVTSLFWKMWFGTPADGGLETLKAQLVGNP